MSGVEAGVAGGAGEQQEAELDSAAVEAILSAVDQAGEQARTTVRVWEKNDYYRLFGQDGEMAAQLIYGSATATRTMGKRKPTCFCGLNRSNFESLLRHVLLVRHYRVEVWQWAGGRYKCEIRASPGNIAPVEHVLYGELDTNRDANFLAGIKLIPGLVEGQYRLGLAAVDTSLNTVQVADLLDTDTFPNLESLLVQLGPREVVLPQTENSAVKKMTEVIERAKILVTQQSSKDFSPLTESEVKRMFSEKADTAGLMKESLSSGALNAVFNYLGFERSDSKFSLEQFSCSTHMRLAARTMAALNVFPCPAQPSQPSLLSILNQTRTPGGARLLHQRLKQPLVDPALISERLDLVQLLVENTELRQLLYEDHLKRFPDLQRLAARFSTGRVGLQDLYRVYTALLRVEPLLQCLQQHSGEDGASYAALQDNFIKDLQEANNDFSNFCKMVETTVDLKQVEQGKFMIQPGFDDDLKSLREQLDEVEEKMSKQLSRAASELDLEADKVLKLEYNTQYGHYFRLTMKDEKAIRGNRNYTVLEQNKSGVKFRNSALERHNDQQAELVRRYEEQQRSIVQEMAGLAAGYSEPLLQLGRTLSSLDVSVSLAVAAVAAPVQFCRPVVEAASQGETARISFTELRHPIVELQDSNFIPNSVKLGPQSSLHLVTGPNMGGKSTFLRSVGCAVLMAQCGSFVPAQDANLTVLDSVMVRIGASDCQVEGVSTFMAEMVETQSILSAATSSSLVLIDELGRGTSTYDGFGLAWAVSEHLASKVRCPTLFTTHYTELTDLADQLDNVHNYHVSALTTEEKLTLLYQLQPGVCSKSFGIEVARIADFPHDVVKNAKKRIAKLESLDSEVSAEKKKKMLMEGEDLIDSYVHKLKNLGDITDEGELKEKFAAIKSEMRNSQNDLILGLVNSAA